MMKERIKLLGAFCQAYCAVIAAAFLPLLIFLLVLLLYALPLEAVLYAALLTLLALLLLGYGCLRRFAQRHEQLQERIRSPLESGEPLPPAQSLIEADYQQLCQWLRTENTRMISAADKSYTELNDYYTLWAHQIKTPIAAMSLLLQGRAAPGDDQLAVELLRIEQYVEMALGYLRSERPEADFVLKPCSLDDIVRQAVHKYAKIFIRKKIALQYSPLNATVVTDEKWLLFVIEQILSNALKYTDAGRVTIYVQPGPVLVIEDSGIGIAPEDLPRVTEKGFTGYNGHADKKSTGIGLYLCSTVLRKLGHTLELESTPGIGTKVKLGLAAYRLQPE